VKDDLLSLLQRALHSLEGSLLATPVDPQLITLERARDAQHGDFASNIAMRLAKAAGKPPRVIAEAIIAALPPSPLLARAEVAGAGFINFFLHKDLYARELARVHSPTCSRPQAIR
jgi:arginyl-tRNA synthetase